MDMLRTIEPKTDQLNADSLVGGPITVTITGVSGNDSAEQPVSIAYAGDDGKPYKPCKSMRRVLVHAWGPDAKTYVGRSMTLYCDPNVQFGGMKVGGLRISHMSHIDKTQVMALTATRAKRAPFTVQPLQIAAPAAVVDVAALVDKFGKVTDQAGFDAVELERANAWKTLDENVKASHKASIKEARDAAKSRLVTALPAAPTAPAGVAEASL